MWLAALDPYDPESGALSGETGRARCAVEGSGSMPFGDGSSGVMRTQPGSRRERAQKLDEPDDLDDLLDEVDDDESELGGDAQADIDDDEPFDPGDDSDLGLDALDDIDDADDESVGLDTSVGFDDSSDDVDLPEVEQDDDEEASDIDDPDGWDADDAGDLPGLDADSEEELDAEEQEYGYTDDDDEAFEHDALDDDLVDEGDGSGDDDGAEGLEDESEMEDLELVQLPALDLNAEEEIGLPGIEGVDELDGVGLPDEPDPVVEIAPGQFWRTLRAGSTHLTRIDWPEDSAVAQGGPVERQSFAMHGSSLLLASSGLYRLDPLTATFRSVALDLTTQLGEHAAGGVIAQAVCVTEHEDVMQVALIVNGRLCISDNAAESFAVQRSPEVTHIGFTHSVMGPHLWWRTAQGELGSDSATSVRARLLAMHADGRRSVAYLERTRDELTLSSSVDGGKSFCGWPLAQLARESEQQLASARIETCGQAVLLSAADTLLCGVHAGELAPVAALASAPATLADEEGEPFVFACVAREDSWWIIRRPARTDPTPPLVLASVPRAELDVPLALVVSYGEDAMLTVYVAAKSALLRIEVSLDGELA